MDGANACLDCTGVSGLRFLQKTAKHGLGAVKQRRSAANQCILAKQIQKTLKKETGGSVFGPRRRERIVFFGKFGDTRLGRLKKGSGEIKSRFFAKSVQTWERQKRVWTTQARADRCSCGVMGISGNQPNLTSTRRAKPM